MDVPWYFTLSERLLDGRQGPQGRPRGQHGGDAPTPEGGGRAAPRTLAEPSPAAARSAGRWRYGARGAASHGVGPWRPAAAFALEWGHYDHHPHPDLEDDPMSGSNRPSLGRPAPRRSRGCCRCSSSSASAPGPSWCSCSTARSSKDGFVASVITGAILVVASWLMRELGCGRLRCANTGGGARRPGAGGGCGQRFIELGPGAVVEVHHAAAETALVQQLERHHGHRQEGPGSPPTTTMGVRNRWIWSRTRPPP